MNSRFAAAALVQAKVEVLGSRRVPNPCRGRRYPWMTTGLALLLGLGLMLPTGNAMAGDSWVPGGQGGHDWLFARAFVGPAFGHGSYLLPEPDIGPKPKDLDLAFNSGGLVYGAEGSLALFRYLTVGFGIWGVWLPLEKIESHDPADFAAHKYESGRGTALTKWNNFIVVLGPSIGFFVKKPWDLYLTVSLGANPYLFFGTSEWCSAVTIGGELMTRKLDLNRFKTLSLGLALQIAQWNASYRSWEDWEDGFAESKTSSLSFTTVGLTLVTILD